MQAQRVKVWFIALFVLLLAFNICDSYQHKYNHNKARSKYTAQRFDDNPEGKIFGWKKQHQPQTNVIFITRPATLSNAPLVSTTTTMLTSPVSAPTVPTAAAAPVTVTTLRRPYAQRGNGIGGGGGGVGVGYRRVPVRRQSLRQGQVNRRLRPWNRRRVWAYGREGEGEGEEENASPSDIDNSGQHSLGEDDRAEVAVSAKLDMEQLEKSLLSQQDTHIDNDAGQIAVVADDLNKVYKQRLKVKSKRPQTTAILATAMPATDAAASNEPTYANIVVNSNGNMKKKKNSESDKRQTIWQGIRQAWRERRKNAAALKKQETQQEEPQVEIENEVAYVDSGNEIFIDENGEIHIRKRRRKNNKRKRQEQQLNIKSKQKQKRRQPVEVTNTIENNENSVISENNTNSRFQNIMNAFRRTPIIYKQHQR